MDGFSTLNDQLFEAAQSGDVAALRGLVAAGADVNHRREDPPGTNLPCLRAATWNGHTAAVEFLLASGADVDASPLDRVGNTALHAAAAIGHVEIMGLLLAAGADVHIMAAHGTPLYRSIGASANHARGAKLLLLHGARVNDVRGMSSERRPLYRAIEFGQRDLVKTFLRAGAREIVTADLPARDERNALTLDLIAAIRSAGGWPEFVAKHRRVLASCVSKLSAKSVVPLDAASHVVAFWSPPGGY